MDKATTFAPALREKHGSICDLFIYYLQLKSDEKIKRIYFWKGLVVRKKALLLHPLWEWSFREINDLIIWDLWFERLAGLENKKKELF